MGINYLTEITNKQQNMSFFNIRPQSFNMFDNLAPIRRQNTKCCNDPYCENNYAKNNVKKAQPQKREPFGNIFDNSFGNFGNSKINSSFFNDGFNFFDEENDAKHPNRRVRTARKTQTRNAPETANKNCYEPKENLKRSAFVAHENQENIDPNFSQNEPKPTPKSFLSSFKSNTVNKNGK